MKRIITLAVIVVVIAMIVFLLVRNKKELDSKKVVSDRSQIPVSVILTAVKELPVSSDLSLPATLSADEEASISAAASGRIETLNIELGSLVSQGQVVGKLDVRESQIKLQSAVLAIEKLEREYERNKRLMEGNATDAKTVQDSKYDLESKRLEADQLRKQIADGNIVSPIRGTITDKKMKKGEFASTGTAVATVIDINTLKARVYVPENNVFKLKEGQKASLATDVFPSETFTGTITYISPKGDDNHNYLVELSVQNNKTHQLRAGVYAKVRFNAGGNDHAIQIPKAALVDGMKNPYVYVAENGKAVERKIVLGREVGENIEVLQGLSAGEYVVSSGQINITEGTLIKSIGTTKNQ